MFSRLMPVAILVFVAAPAALADDKPKTKGIDKPFAITLPFSKISTAGEFEIDVIAAPIVSVIARGDMPGLDLVNAAVVGDTLQITQSPAPVGVKIKSIKAKLTIQTPTLAGLQATGTNKVTIRKLRAGDFDLSQQGKGEVVFDDARFSTLNVSVLDGTRVQLSGNCETINAEAKSGGQISAADLRCNEANVKLGGKGEASVRARSKINAELTGTGSLKVKDKPGDVNVSARDRTDVDFEN